MKIPLDEIALAAFDGPVPSLIPEEVLFVNMVQQIEEMGRSAVRIVCERIEGSESPGQIRLTPHDGC